MFVFVAVRLGVVIFVEVRFVEVIFVEVRFVTDNLEVADKFVNMPFVTVMLLTLSPAAYVLSK